MENIKLNFKYNKKLLSKIHLKVASEKIKKGFHYDCVLDSGAETLYCIESEKELYAFETVPFCELNVSFSPNKFSKYDKGMGKFLKASVTSATEITEAVKCVLRSVVIGNFIMFHVPCLFYVVSEEKLNFIIRYQADYRFLFPLLDLIKNEAEIKMKEEFILIKEVSPIYKYQYNQIGNRIECVNTDRVIHFTDDVLCVIENIENDSNVDLDIRNRNHIV